MTIENKIKLLLELAAHNAQYPFPYQGCRLLHEKNKSATADLIPLLDLYLMDIAGYVSWGKKIKDWSKEKAKEVHSSLRQSFFDKYPDFMELQTEITKQETPDLHECLKIYEEMRLHLLAICDDIENQ